MRRLIIRPFSAEWWEDGKFLHGAVFMTDSGKPPDVPQMLDVFFEEDMPEDVTVPDYTGLIIPPGITCITTSSHDPTLKRILCSNEGSAEVSSDGVYDLLGLVWVKSEYEDDDGCSQEDSYEDNYRLDIPATLLIHNCRECSGGNFVVIKSFAYHILHTLEDGRRLCLPWNLGNTYDDGAVCWGNSLDYTSIQMSFASFKDITGLTKMFLTGSVNSDLSMGAVVDMDDLLCISAWSDTPDEFTIDASCPYTDNAFDVIDTFSRYAYTVLRRTGMPWWEYALRAHHWAMGNHSDRSASRGRLCVVFPDGEVSVDEGHISDALVDSVAGLNERATR